MDPHDKILRQDLSLPGLPPEHLRISTQEAEIELQINLRLSDVRKLDPSTATDLKLLSECISGVAADSDLLAVCGGHTLSVYSASSHDLLQTYEDELCTEDYCALTWGLVAAPALTPWLFIGTSNGLIKVLDVGQATFINELVGHLGGVTELRVRSAETTQAVFLLSASLDYTVRLWNVVSQVQVAVFGGVLGHSKEVMSLDLHPSTTVFVTGGADCKVMLWQISPQVENSMQDSCEADRRPMMNRSRIFCSTRQFPTLFDREPVYETRRVHRSIVDCVRFAGNLLVSKAQEGLIVVWKPNIFLWKDGVVVLYTLPIDDSFMFPLKFTIFKPLDLLYIGGLDGQLRTFSLLSGKKLIAAFKLGTAGLVSRVCVGVQGDSGFALSNCVQSFKIDIN
jgi:WD40 repeat protein